MIRVGHHQARKINKVLTRKQDRPLALQQQQKPIVKIAHQYFGDLGRPTGFGCLVVCGGTVRVLTVPVTVRLGIGVNGFCGTSPTGEVWCVLVSLVRDLGGSLAICASSDYFRFSLVWSDLWLRY
jgi:hypothetical protein